MPWPPIVNFTFRLAGEQNFTVPTKELYDFAAVFESLKIAADLDLFVVEPLPMQDQYRYRFRSSDGRLWEQTLLLPDAGEASMTFEVADAWLVSEFAPHREVRDAAIALIKAVGIQEIRWRKE